jgi:hypothetical protein
MFSKSSRDKDDLHLEYRHTDMKGERVNISIRDVTHGPKDVTAKLLGSYFNDGLVSPLLVEDDEPANKIEAFLKS